MIKGIFVDGSFVTSKAIPSDIDLVVVHDEDDYVALDDHVNAEFLYEDRHDALQRYLAALKKTGAGVFEAPWSRKVEVSGIDVNVFGLNSAA